jgi:hypothetical protein
MIAKIRSLFRELGVVTTISYAFARLLQRLLKLDMIHYHFYAQPISRTPRVPERKSSQYVFELLHQNSTLLTQLDRPDYVIENRFDQGAVCIAARKGDLFLGCIWLIKNRYVEDEVRAVYHFPDSTVWDFDVYVSPTKRLTPLFAALWDKADSWIKSQGAQASLSRISAYNASSIRAHVSSGAKKIGWMIAIRGNRYQLTFSSLKPYFHFSASVDDPGPNLRFDHCFS